MRPADLEGLVQRELDRLRAPQAPATLLPRVMAAVHAWARRPWFRRAWFTWPRAWQAAAVAALMLGAASVALVLPGVFATVAGAISVAAPDALRDDRALAGLVESARQMDVLLDAARVVRRALLQPIVAYVCVLVVLMWLALAAFALALNQLVLGKAFS